jgi:hypothetical protein
MRWGCGSRRIVPLNGGLPFINTDITGQPSAGRLTQDENLCPCFTLNGDIHRISMSATELL